MYPANDPPTHANIAGVKLGALPWFALARSLCAAGGDGLFRIAMYGIKGRSDAYLSYGGSTGLAPFIRWWEWVSFVAEGVVGSGPETGLKEEVEDDGLQEDEVDEEGLNGEREGGEDGGASALSISLCRRGMKPGSMAVPPDTRIEEASVLRRSTGILSSEFKIVSAKLLSSTSPSNITSPALSLIHPGIIRVPIPVPVCCTGCTRICRSVAVECFLYIDARACRYPSDFITPPRSDVSACELVIIENSEGALMLSKPECPDSDGALLSGFTISTSESAVFVFMMYSSWNLASEPRAVPTKQHRALISSTTLSLRTSGGTRVARFAAGTLMAALSDDGGGR